MKVEKIGDNYLIKLTHDELLSLVNGLGARNLLIRDVASVINPDSSKKKQKELDKIHKALAEALPPDAWDKEVTKSDRTPARQKHHQDQGGKGQGESNAPAV